MTSQAVLFATTWLAAVWCAAASHGARLHCLGLQSGGLRPTRGHHGCPGQPRRDHRRDRTGRRRKARHARDHGDARRGLAPLFAHAGQEGGREGWPQGHHDHRGRRLAPAAGRGFSPDRGPEVRTVENVASWKGLMLEEHHGSVTWRVPLAANAAGKAADVHGTVSLQLCQDTACTPPETISFSATCPAGGRPPAVSAAVEPCARARPHAARGGVRGPALQAKRRARMAGDHHAHPRPGLASLRPASIKEPGRPGQAHDRVAAQSARAMIARCRRRGSWRKT